MIIACNISKFVARIIFLSEQCLLVSVYILTQDIKLNTFALPNSKIYLKILYPAYKKMYFFRLKSHAFFLTAIPK